MGLFKKKNKKYTFSQYDQRGKNNNPVITSFDRIAYMVVTTSSDEMLFEICDKVLSGYPVLVKFENIDTNEANRMLSFMSGVVYATDGELFKIQPRLFLFGRKEEFEDGSLYQYVEDLK